MSIPNTLTIPKLSPFKLLSSYQKEDIHYYFGRDKETRQLYDALMRSKFMMVYGASGTGKTSLIQCGLQSMFSPRDWMPVLIRRRDDFLKPIRDELYNRYLERFEEFRQQQIEWYPEEPAPEPEEFDNLRDLIKALFHISYVPIYLILDQFEEIFTLGDQPEQQAFFQALDELKLFSEDLFCKIIIVTREEYLAHFYRYENKLPFLFEYRFRVEKMREEQLMQVISGILTSPYKDYPEFKLEDGTAQQILSNLMDERGEVDLTTLQVYLDYLYQKDRERAEGRSHIYIDQQLAKENQLTDVLSDFLDRQVKQVSRKVYRRPSEQESKSGSNIPLQVLFKMVTSQGTKQNRNADEIYQELKLGKSAISLEEVELCLDEFAKPESRILNPLRYAKTDAKRYEIMHDRLAERIFSKFNSDELRRREATITIRNKLKRFREVAKSKKQKLEYMSIGEIELVDQSLNTQQLPQDLKTFFDESNSYHVNRRKKERWLTIGAVIAAAFFLGVAIFAVLATQRADRSERNLNFRLAFEAEEIKVEVENLRQRSQILQDNYPETSDSLIKDAYYLLFDSIGNPLPLLQDLKEEMETQHPFLASPKQ